MATVSYSGTPLARKLGLKKGHKIKIVNNPIEYFDLFEDFPSEVEIIDDDNTKKDFIHYFTTSASELERDIEILKQEIVVNGMIWISWPKKSANVKTDLDANLVREIGLRNGLVDVKVCAINVVWSGLKFVIPVKDRR